MKPKSENERRERQDWGIVFLILLFGFLCVAGASQWALRLSPSWTLDANVQSGLNPNTDFLTKPSGFVEPVDASILTQPAWVRIFLTPGAKFVTGTALPAGGPTSAVPTAEIETTVLPGITSTLPAGTSTIVPTNTLIWIPLPATLTPKPKKTSVPPTTPSADLQITKNDGTATYIPGGTLIYTIVVSNPLGPSNVTGAKVVDTFPAQISGFAPGGCVVTGGATCGWSGTGNINDTVNLPVGSTITYTVHVNINPGASGNLANTASVSMSAGYTELDPTDNASTDTDAPSINADLRITKTGSASWYSPGAPFTYTIVVSNTMPGSNNVSGVTITDTFPTQVFLGGTTWNCVAAGSATCTSNGTGNINDTVNLPFGSSITYTVNVAFNAGASGTLTNQATVGGGSYTETNPADNTASTNSSPGVDLQIAKSDGVGSYTAGGTLTYTITVTNNSAFAVNGITVTDVFSVQIAGLSWSCAPAAICTSGGTGDINDTINMPAGPGSVATYTVNATMSGSAAGSLTNTASVTTPAGFTELNGANNSATDTDAGPNGGPGGEVNIGGPNGSVYTLPDGGAPLVMAIPPIVANGDVGTYDFVFYEMQAGGAPTPPATNPRVDLDWVQIEISTDGISWQTVFYWGDGSSDDNTNVALPVNGPPGPAGTFCATEVDNCQIPFARLYNTRGIAIDIDPIVPAGNYSWIRITAPASPGGDGSDVDSIQILP